MVAVAECPNGASAACDTAWSTAAKSCTTGRLVGGLGVGSGVARAGSAAGSHWAKPDPLGVAP